MTENIRFGQIAWAEIADVNGVRKARPVVVVTPDDRIDPARPLEVVAVSSFLSDPLRQTTFYCQGTQTGIRRLV